MKEENLRKGYKTWIIRHKSCDIPWSMNIFHTEEGAWKYFGEVCSKYFWEFPIDDYVVERVVITHSPGVIKITC